MVYRVPMHVLTHVHVYVMRGDNYLQVRLGNGVLRGGLMVILPLRDEERMVWKREEEVWGGVNFLVWVYVLDMI